MEQNIIIVVESSNNFYELLSTRLTDLKERHNIIQSFYVHFHASIHGCSCRKQANITAANEFYKQLKSLPQQIKDEIKLRLNATKLLFFENKDLFIFEF
jgi:histidinol phosphatase-like enzyme